MICSSPNRLPIILPSPLRDGLYLNLQGRQGAGHLHRCVFRE